MIKTKKQKIITLSIVFGLVLFLAIGFSAFSNSLFIETALKLEPSGEFKVVFSSNATTLKTDSIKPTTTGRATAGNASIDNSVVPTFTNLSATFEKPGDKVEYNFYVLNNGAYDAYLTNINFNNASGGSSFKVCKLDSDNSSLSSACNSIKATIKIGDVEATSTKSVKNHLLKIGASQPVSVTLEYVSGVSAQPEPFTVEFGDINLIYSSLNESISTNDTPYNQVFKPDYYWYDLYGYSGSYCYIGFNLSNYDISSFPPSSFETVYGDNVYIGIDSDDGETISRIYACFNKDGREYCLKGSDSTLNETNKKILYETNKKIMIDAFGESACNSGTDENIGNYYRCTNNLDNLSISIYDSIQDDYYWDSNIGFDSCRFRDIGFECEA